MEMIREYKFGFGGLEEVASGELEKKDSPEELIFPKSKNRVIIPKVIGVYQERVAYDENHKIQIACEDQTRILEITGQRERISPDLICIVYDPTILKDFIVNGFLKGDILNRVKVVGYIDLPDFYAKKISDLNKNIAKTYSNPNKGNISVLKKQKKILESVKQAYGLTRYEAVDLLIIENLLEELKEAPEKIKEAVRTDSYKKKFGF